MSRNPAPDPAHDTARGSAEGDAQLRLLPGRVGRTDWVLDERTRRAGRVGVAQAREILRRARPPQPRGGELSKAS